MPARGNPPIARFVVGLVAAFVLGVLVGWAARGPAGDTAASQPGAPSAAAEPDATVPDGCDPITGFASVEIDELPPEAADTLASIESGPPYEFRQDGGTFQNREQLLPLHDRGYYREFTVVTPGSDDRGARRIVAGDCGERWYTHDHYESFRLIEFSP